MCVRGCVRVCARVCVCVSHDTFPGRDRRRIQSSQMKNTRTFISFMDYMLGMHGQPFHNTAETQAQQYSPTVAVGDTPSHHTHRAACRVIDNTLITKTWYCQGPRAVQKRVLTRQMHTLRRQVWWIFHREDLYSILLPSCARSTKHLNYTALSLDCGTSACKTHSYQTCRSLVRSKLVSVDFSLT